MLRVGTILIIVLIPSFFNIEFQISSPCTGSMSIFFNSSFSPATSVDAPPGAACLRSEDWRVAMEEVDM